MQFVSSVDCSAPPSSVFPIIIIGVADLEHELEVSRDAKVQQGGHSLGALARLLDRPELQFGLPRLGDSGVSGIEGPVGSRGQGEEQRGRQQENGTEPGERPPPSPGGRRESDR